MKEYYRKRDAQRAALKEVMKALENLDYSAIFGTVIHRA